MVDASERLMVLLDQEATSYRTSDYIPRLQQCVDSSDADPREPSDVADESAPETPSKKRKSPLCSAEDSNHRKSFQSGQAAPGGSSADISSNSQINKHWREKICEWAYQGK